jgi:hypothetical protein
MGKNCFNTANNIFRPENVASPVKFAFASKTLNGDFLSGHEHILLSSWAKGVPQHRPYRPSRRVPQSRWKGRSPKQRRAWLRSLISIKSFLIYCFKSKACLFSWLEANTFYVFEFMIVPVGSLIWFELCFIAPLRSHML